MNLLYLPELSPDYLQAERCRPHEALQGLTRPLALHYKENAWGQRFQLYNTYFLTTKPCITHKHKFKKKIYWTVLLFVHTNISKFFLMLVLSTNEIQPICYGTFFSHSCIMKLSKHKKLKELYYEQLCTLLRFYN